MIIRYAAAMLRHPLLDRWRALPVTLRDAQFGVLLAAIAFLPALASYGTRLGELPHRPTDVLAVAAAFTMSLSLAARRSRPAVALALVAVGFTVQELQGYESFASLGLIVAIYSAGAHQERFRPWMAGAATVWYVLLAIALHAAGAAPGVGDFITFYLSLAIAAAVGANVRSHRHATAERLRLEGEVAVAAERARIARELHDVVTHHVTAMVVQANAGQFLAADPAKATQVMVTVSDTGRRALGELRDLLGVLDPTREAEPASRPAPSGDDLAKLAGLVEQTRAAGLPVTLTEDGDVPPMGAGRETAIYRVVQEALTNALKYAAGAPVEVRLSYHRDRVEIVVTSGPGQSTPGVGGSGRGLTGLRERVSLFGGTLDFGPAPGGDFVVSAVVPLAQ